MNSLIAAAALVLLANGYTTNAAGFCGEGWVNSPIGKCYMFMTSTKGTWSDAQAFCLRQGGSLVQLNTMNEIIWLKGYRLQYRLLNGFWIGGRRKDDRWYWQGSKTLAPMAVTDWMAGQPDNLTGKQDCVALFYHTLSSGLQWGDGNCDVKLNFICEKEASPLIG